MNLPERLQKAAQGAAKQLTDGDPEHWAIVVLYDAHANAVGLGCEPTVPHAMVGELLQKLAGQLLEGDFKTSATGERARS